MPARKKVREESEAPRSQTERDQVELVELRKEGFTVECPTPQLLHQLLALLIWVAENSEDGDAEAAVDLLAALESAHNRAQESAKRKFRIRSLEGNSVA